MILEELLVLNQIRGPRVCREVSATDSVLTCYCCTLVCFYILPVTFCVLHEFHFFKFFIIFDLNQSLCLLRAHLQSCFPFLLCDGFYCKHLQFCACYYGHLFDSIRI